MKKFLYKLLPEISITPGNLEYNMTSRKKSNSKDYVANLQITTTRRSFRKAVEKKNIDIFTDGDQLAKD